MRSAVTRSGSTKFVDTAFEYDTYGNRTKETIYNEYAGTTAASSDPRSTTIAYDGIYHTFPITTTNAEGHVESRTFDADFGVPLTVTDINGHVSTTLIYDGFGRLKTSSVGPSAGIAQPISRRPGTPTALPGLPIGKTTTSLAVEMRTDDDDSAKAWHKHCRIYDGRGMIVQEYSDTERGQLVVNRRFDGRGLLVPASRPPAKEILPRSAVSPRGSGARTETSSPPAPTTLSAGRSWSPCPTARPPSTATTAGPARWSTRTITSSAGTATASAG